MIKQYGDLTEQRFNLGDMKMLFTDDKQYCTVEIIAKTKQTLQEKNVLSKMKTLLNGHCILQKIDIMPFRYNLTKCERSYVLSSSQILMNDLDSCNWNIDAHTYDDIPERFYYGISFAILLEDIPSIEKMMEYIHQIFQ
jgi:hypothetical protein